MKPLVRAQMPKLSDLGLGKSVKGGINGTLSVGEIADISCFGLDLLDE